MTAKKAQCGPFRGADARIRTADPFITSEVLYQLSYVGADAQSTAASSDLKSG
jgi:hypothetical protein